MACIIFRKTLQLTSHATQSYPFLALTLPLRVFVSRGPLSARSWVCVLRAKLAARQTQRAPLLRSLDKRY